MLERVHQGDPIYMYRVARCFEFGLGFPLDFQQALSLYRLCAIQGSNSKPDL